MRLQGAGLSALCPEARPVPGTDAGTDSLSSGVTQGPAFQEPTLGLGVDAWGQGLELKEAVQETGHKDNFCGSGEEARLGVGGLNPRWCPED